MVIFQEGNISVVLNKNDICTFMKTSIIWQLHVDISLQRYLNEVVDINEVGGSLLLHLLLLYRSSIHRLFLYLAPAPPWPPWTDSEAHSQSNLGVRLSDDQQMISRWSADDQQMISRRLSDDQPAVNVAQEWTHHEKHGGTDAKTKPHKIPRDLRLGCLHTFCPLIVDNENRN